MDSDRGPARAGIELVGVEPNPGWLPLSPSDSSFGMWMTAALVSIVTLIYFLLSFILQKYLLLTEIPVVVALGIALSIQFPNMLVAAGGAQLDRPAELEKHSFEHDSAYDLLRTFAIIVVGVQLMSSGLHIPNSFLCDRRTWLSTTLLLTVVQTVMAGVSAALLHAFFHEQLGSWWVSWAVAAACTPTDPVLASALVRGRFSVQHLSTDVRELFTLESSSNDGTAFPLVFLGLYLLEPGASTGSAMGVWFANAWAWNVVFAVGLGVGVGYASAHALHFCHARGWANHEAVFPFSIALFLLLTSVAELLGTNSFLAVFTAALAVNHVLSPKAMHVYQQEDLQATAVSLDLIGSVALFFVLSSFFSFSNWSLLGYGRLIGWAALSFLFRRIPAVMLTYAAGGLRNLVSWKEALFFGWFAPAGAASSYYAIVVAEHLEKYSRAEAAANPVDGSGPASATAGERRAHAAFHLVLWLILASVVMHGLLGPSAALGLYRWQKPVYRQEDPDLQEDNQQQEEKSKEPEQP